MSQAAPDVLERAADLVTRARSDRRPVPALPFDLAERDAYAVQRFNVDRALSAGARRAGFKIGLTSEPVRRQLGATQPDFGILFADAQVRSTADVAAFVQPRIEAEIAFVLSSDLPAELDPADSPRFIAFACAAAEIVDSIYQDWRFDVVGAVADNGCAAGFALAEQQVPIDRFDRIGATMTMTRDGEQVSAGSGAATMGDPFNALAWLAGEASAQGETPRAGDVILTGALGPMTDLVAGSTYRISIDGLGALSIRAVAGNA